MLAYLRREPGWDTVREALSQLAVISIVNLSEVLSKRAEGGLDPGRDIAELERDGVIGTIGGVMPNPLIQVQPYELEDAVEVARLRPLTRAFGLSLGDRACLATATRLRTVALTADRRWAEIPGLSVSVRLIR